MIDEICGEIRNYFVYKDDKVFGDFQVVNGALVPSVNIPSDYIRIVGSRKNNGVHKVSEMTLKDEPTFHGAIWFMNPPDEFLAIVEEIKAWQAKHGDIDSPAMSPFNSESFGGYSYSKGYPSVGSAGSASGADWRSVYASRLKQYRRILL